MKKCKTEPNQDLSATTSSFFRRASDSIGNPVNCLVTRPLKVTDKGRQYLGLGEGLFMRHDSQSFRLHTKHRKSKKVNNPL